MSAVLIVLFFAVITLGGIAGRWPRIDAEAHAELLKTRDRLDIPADGPYPQAAHARFVARRRGRLLGLLGGTVVVFAVVAVQAAADRNGSGFWFMLGPICMGIGSMLGALNAPPQRPSGAVSVSIAPRTAAAYLPVAERAVTLFAPVLALAGAVVAALMLARGTVHGVAGWAAVLVCCASIVLWLVLQRFVGALLAQPTPGADRTELAWHEVLRALSLRDVVSAQALTCLAATASPMSFGDGWSFEGGGEAAAATWLALAAGIALTVLLVVQLLDIRFAWFRGHAGREVLA